MTKRSTILVVDDELINIHVISSALKDEYNIITADNGFAALDLIKNPQPDLVLLDVMMPGLNGYDVCSSIKAEATFSDIPVIFLTALDTQESAQRGFEVGAIDYVVPDLKLFY